MEVCDMGYGFILNMWMMKKIDEAKVKSYVPFFITKEESDMIIIAPQWENYSPASVKEQL